MTCSPPGSFVHGILQTRILEWVVMPASGNLPNPGIEPTVLMSPALAGRFFTTELPGRPLLYARDSANTVRGCVYTCVFVVVKLNTHVAFSALQVLVCALYKYYLIFTMR